MSDGQAQIARVLSQPETVIVVGAGVSAWAGLPTWPQLLLSLQAFLNEHGYDSSLLARELTRNDLVLAASLGFDQLDEHERLDFLKAQFSRSRQPSELHFAIADLPTTNFITTNYDTLLEQALQVRRPNETFNVVTSLHRLEITEIVQAHARNYVFKPHGDINNFDSIILTREHYRELQSNRRNALEAFRTILVSHPVVFIGFGLRDPDFLLTYDTLLSVFNTVPKDHYAIMPDIGTNEAAYWKRNYGINIVAYPTTKTATDESLHQSLLELLKSTKNYANNSLATDEAPGSAELPDSTTILALARHARRMESSIEPAHSMVPLLLGPPPGRSMTSGLDPLWGKKALESMLENRTAVILEGPPGCGKTFTLLQVARRLAVALEEACLVEGEANIGDRRKFVVPIVLNLRDYEGDFRTMAVTALPESVNFDKLIRDKLAWFFLDGANEIPARFALNRLVTELSTFLSTISGNPVVISTRFSKELESLRLPVYTLDEIPRQYLSNQLANDGVDLEALDAATVNLLKRPLFFRAYSQGAISIAEMKSVQDIYVQITESLATQLSESYGAFQLPEIFSEIAHEMIDAGQLTISSGKLRAKLAGRPEFARRSVDDFINETLRVGVLVPVAQRRLAFFHHSITEYFAAKELARAVENDVQNVHHYLRRRDWDQCLLLCLGFLKAPTARAVFDNILDIDPLMALRSLQYVETDRAAWTTTALEYIHRNIDTFQTHDDEFLIAYSLSALQVNSNDENLLVALGGQNGSLGGRVTAMLWKHFPPRRSQILSMFAKNELGYNFLARLGESLTNEISPEDGWSLIEYLLDIPIPDELASRLLLGEECDECVAVLSGSSAALEGISVDIRLDWCRSVDHLIARHSICESLRHVRSPAVIDMLQDFFLDGDKSAITNLYFCLKFGTPAGDEVGLPKPGVLSELIGAIRGNVKPGWAVGVLREWISLYPSLAPSEEFQRSTGVLGAICALLTGYEADYFAALSRLPIGSPDFRMPAGPVEALGHIEIDWRGQEPLLVRLLESGDDSLAVALIDSLGLHRGKQSALCCKISSPRSWLHRIRKLMHGKDFYFKASRFGAFLAMATDVDTRTLLIDEFNQSIEYRDVLSELVLDKVSDLKIDEFTQDSLAWCVERLQNMPIRPMSSSILSEVSTPEFVDEYLIPLYRGAPNGLLKTNLLILLSGLGRRHGRRYIDRKGSLMSNADSAMPGSEPPSRNGVM